MDETLERMDLSRDLASLSKRLDEGLDRYPDLLQEALEDLERKFRLLLAP